MKPVLSAPDITGIDRLYEIYLTLPDRDKSIVNVHYFYDFLQKNTIERQIFLDTYCNFEFLQVNNTVVLKVLPKE